MCGVRWNPRIICTRRRATDHPALFAGGFFGAGKYTIEVIAIDLLSNETIIRTADFTLIPAAPRRKKQAARPTPEGQRLFAGERRRRPRRSAAATKAKARNLTSNRRLPPDFSSVTNEIAIFE